MSFQCALDAVCDSTSVQFRRVRGGSAAAGWGLQSELSAPASGQGTEYRSCRRYIRIVIQRNSTKESVISAPALLAMRAA